MHVCTYTHLYVHIYFTACGPPKHQCIMSGVRTKMILCIACVVKNRFVCLKAASMKCNMLTYLSICNLNRLVI